MKKLIRLNRWIGVACFFGLLCNLFNDDPVASVLAWGFIGVIAAMHVLFGNNK